MCGDNLSFNLASSSPFSIQYYILHSLSLTRLTFVTKHCIFILPFYLPLLLFDWGYCYVHSATASSWSDYLLCANTTALTTQAEKEKERERERQDVKMRMAVWRIGERERERPNASGSKGRGFN